MRKSKTDLKNLSPRLVFGGLLFLGIFFAQTAFAQVVINEIQISPTNERFIELYNLGGSDIDLTGWYIQRKTATGNDFSSLVTSPNFVGKLIKADGYFLISRTQLGKSDMVYDLTLTESNTIRIRDSKGKDADQIKWGSIGEGKSYQRTATGEWIITTPTPGTVGLQGGTLGTTQTTTTPQNAEKATAPVNLSNFPVEPQIIAEAGLQARTTLVGAPITFSGKVFGLKKEPIENARMSWSFGDGGGAEGASVLHTYYYPGEYTAVLDASSGYYSASDRVRVLVVTPNLALRTGGDNARSFVVIENRAGDELDLSGWQVSANGKNFVLPKNTLLGARGSITLASEVTGLATPIDSSASLHFPNGAQVELQGEIISTVPAVPIAKESFQEKKILKPLTKTYAQVSKTSPQEASTAGLLSDIATPAHGKSEQKIESVWPWYIASAFLGALALLGLRFARSKRTLADEFEIIEEKD